MDTIDRIRAFNRYYTRQIGLVGRNYVSGGFSLSALRVLYELGQVKPPTARQLARELALDEGYLSRILAKFINDGWLEKVPDANDRRVKRLKLSKSGQVHYGEIVAQARDKTGRMIADLDKVDQARIVRAMELVQSLLSNDVSPVTLRQLRVGDAGWLIQQHALLYQQDDGFDDSFEALVAEILADFIRYHDPECERGFIAERDGVRLGSVFCVRETTKTAKLRLFLLLPEARGLGLGKRLLGECMSFAKSVGYCEMKLWTHESHHAACALYRSFGWQLTGSKPVHSFGVDLIEQSWRVDL